MKKYMLNGLGNDWIYEAENEEEATKQFIDGVGGFSTVEEYEKYCIEDLQCEPEIEWEEVTETEDEAYERRMEEYAQSQKEKLELRKSGFYGATVARIAIESEK